MFRIMIRKPRRPFHDEDPGEFPMAGADRKPIRFATRDEAAAEISRMQATESFRRLPAMYRPRYRIVNRKGESV